MLKKYFHTVIAILVLVAIVTTTLIVLPWERFQKSTTIVLDDNISRAQGMYLFGASNAPYTVGDVAFFATKQGNYRFKMYGKDGTPEVIEEGFDASSWEEIESNQIIKGSGCRNITLVSTNSKGIVKEVVYYDYVPGIIYGHSNPNQYDDLLIYNEENPLLEDERAIKIASNLFKSNLTSYVQNDYGSIIQGFLSKYSNVGGLLEGYYHTGTDFTIHNNQPFYSIVDGVITYAEGTDDYNMITIYCEKQDISVFILHGKDITPAKELFKNGGVVKKGDLLGYGGSAGDPVGDTHIHLEVRRGKEERYKSFSKEIQYTRMSNYDPLLLADFFELEVLQENGYTPFSKLKTTSFDGQNNASCVLSGQWLYYIDKNDNNKIYKARPDGTTNSVLVDSPCANLNYYDGWLYYSDLGANGHLTKTKADGSQTVKITEVDTRDFILVQEDWIYFANSLDKDAIYKIKHDGTERKELVRRDVSDIFYYDNAIYYTQNARLKAQRIWKLDLTTGKINQVSTSRADKPFVYQGNLCYRKFYENKVCLSLPLTNLSEDNATVLIPHAYNQIQIGNRYLMYTRENDGDSIYVKFDDLLEPIKLTNDTLCQNLTVQGGWLYYYTPTLEGGNTLTRINVYGLKKQRLFVEGWTNVDFDAEPGFDGYILASRTKTEYPDATPVPTLVATPTATATPVPTPTPTPNPNVTEEPIVIEETPTPTPIPTLDPIITPSVTPEPTQAPVQETPTPTQAPTPEPTPETTENT